ncbi:hypothetical protein BDFB_001800 [Asbolus verrucosus]|uniref:Ig-like domain-containing protein n=1 Tax=Asbolus verrucosus TaxID=1661398 RepID=A0A482VQV7_ASBVE|nr:hypothetical protein BDFB_001800 [Asbolus verrucosus]
MSFFSGSAKITIKHLDVPASISVHENEVVLDCDFDPQGENVDSIKWFFNGTTDLIYQWLPTEKTGPQVANRLKDRIDLNYAVSDDSKTKYRAMHIKKLSPDLSGNYSCKVSGPRSEDVKTKRMIIYDPADSQLELNITEDFDPDVNVTDDEMVAISCSAQGIYPEPDLRIFISVNNGTAIEADDEDEDSDVDNSGVYDVYDVSSTVLYDIDKLPGSFDYTCELSIPGTDYVLRETRKYNRGNYRVVLASKDMQHLKQQSFLYLYPRLSLAYCALFRGWGSKVRRQQRIFELA